MGQILISFDIRQRCQGIATMKADARIPILASAAKRVYEINEIYGKGTKTWRLGNEALKVNANKGVFLKKSYLTKKEVRGN